MQQALHNGVSINALVIRDKKKDRKKDKASTDSEAKAYKCKLQAIEC